MYYIFIVNGRQDRVGVQAELEKQLSGTPTEKYRYYTTSGVGDATRFVRTYCEFHPDEEICFVSCGGSGTANEIASGLIGHTYKKCMAMMAYGASNDFTKCFPDLDFKSVQALFDSDNTMLIDAIKCNDDYAINVANIGFDAMASIEANLCIEEGIKDAYSRGVLRALLFHRYNRLKVVADGEDISYLFTILCSIANAKYYGSMFYCAPRAKLDDGLLDLCLIRSISLIEFLIFFRHYKNGTHLDSRFCKRRLRYRQCRHVEISSSTLRYLSLDGEITASDKFVIDVLDKAIPLRLPTIKKEASV